MSLPAKRSNLVVWRKLLLFPRKDTSGTYKTLLESQDDPAFPLAMAHHLLVFFEQVRARAASSLRVAGTGLVLALIVGCGTAPTPTVEVQVDPQEVLRGAVNRLMTLESTAFTLEHRVGTSVLLPGLEMNRVYGVAVIPDRFRFTVEAQISGAYVETDMVVIGQQAYMTNFFTGNWEEVPMEVLPLNFADLGRTLSDILLAVEAPTLAGTQTLRGHRVYLIQGGVHSEDLSALVPNAGVGFDVVLELAVDQKEGLLLQVVITGQVVDTDADETVRVLSLDDFDVPVDIEAPQ